MVSQPPYLEADTYVNGTSVPMTVHRREVAKDGLQTLASSEHG